MNATFLSLDHFYISTKPNFPHGPPIKGNSVCNQAKHAWISWCKTTCTLIAVLNICMFKACIFPALFCPPRWHLFIFSAFHTVWIMIRCAKDNLPKRFRCTCRTILKVIILTFFIYIYYRSNSILGTI